MCLTGDVSCREQFLIYSLPRQAFGTFSHLQHLIFHRVSCAVMGNQKSRHAFESVMRGDRVQRRRLTFATSAVCWKYDNEDACSVIRSVGEELGALYCRQFRFEAYTPVGVIELDSPVDQEQGI
jgi:hypothetical protein